ncbi:MAG: type II secretion system GspH family protein [Deltaproteobacteria bacterium]|nr:type II secretion system GspH family protein [Deltaproteobacteria bacterium]
MFKMRHAPKNRGFFQKTRAWVAQERGFTLVEILVAMGIFSFAVLGLAVGTVTLTRTNADAHSRANAVNLAQARFEELKAMNRLTLTAMTATCPAFSSGGCSDSSLLSGTTFARSWKFATVVLPTGGNATQIDVKVDWTDHGARSMTLSTAVPQ